MRLARVRTDIPKTRATADPEILSVQDLRSAAGDGGSGGMAGKNGFPEHPRMIATEDPAILIVASQVRGWCGIEDFLHMKAPVVAGGSVVMRESSRGRGCWLRGPDTWLFYVRTRHRFVAFSSPEAHRRISCSLIVLTVTFLSTTASFFKTHFSPFHWVN